MALLPDLLQDLTVAQREAVTHGEGPLLILAGAGSGKTRVITRRVAYLLQQGVRPSNILAITFTNKAAGEMRARVEQLVPGNRVWISTFHSLGARLLRQYSDRLNFDRNFTVYDVEDRNKLIKQAIAHLDLDDNKFKPDRVAGVISKAKNLLQSPKLYEQEARDYFSQAVAKIYFAYEKRLRAANGMDFDDLLYLPAMALRLNEEFRADLDARFRYVLIDEYQDTNFAQYEIARQLSLHHPNLCVVGDPDQSIYKWRGSDIRNILDFERDYPDARVVTLEQNYRSTKAILQAASTLIDNNKQRKKKSLKTQNADGIPVRVLTFENGLDEAEGVVLQIKEAVEAGRYRYRDYALFLRINALTRSLESAFIKHGVPFQIVRGLAFFERKENKDILAYLRLIVNPQDTVSFLRVVNEPGRGIGKVSLDRLQRYAEDQEISLMAAAGHIHKIAEIRGKAATGLKDFYRLLTDLRATTQDLAPHEIIKAILEQTGYRKMLIDSSDEEDADRLANIEELITAARQFHEEDPTRTLSDFLEQVSLASDVDAWDESSDRVSVMTLHAAKGLEFPVVFVMACEQGLLPHDRSLHNDDDVEEERRLCYGGMTRAMKELTLSHARKREFRGQVLYAVPSMFIGELPESVQQIDYASRVNTGRAALEEWRQKVQASADSLGYASKPPELTRTRSPEHANTETASYSKGQIVNHAEYGIGQIADVSGIGALRKVKIRFASAGEKTFVAEKVKLQVIKRKQ